MKNNATTLYNSLLLLGDFSALFLAFILAYFLRVQIDHRALVVQVPFTAFLKAFVVLLPFWLAIFGMLGLYIKEIYEKRFREYVRLLVGCVIGIMAIISFDYFNNNNLFPARLVPVYALVLSFGLLILERTILRFGRRILFSKGIGVSNVFIIGSGPGTSELLSLLSNRTSTGYQVVKFIGKHSLLPKGLGIDHSTDITVSLQDLTSIHTIIQTELFSDVHTNQMIVDSAHENHVSYKFIPTQTSLYTGNNKIELFENFPVIAVHRTKLIGWGRVAKRLFDLIGASLAILLCIPLFLLIGMIIKITDPSGPIFYKHKRVSRFGTTFYVYKLRSFYWKYSTGSGKKTDLEIFKEMGREDLVEEWMRDHKVRIDPRIMPIGRFTRKTSIDELPQLWNVIKGELSLIGPRAVTKEELTRYKEASSLFLSIKPGITGLWQVSGRNSLSYEERIKLDLFYVQHWSFLLDLKITYWTILTMLKGNGQ